jgi:hypothetical protein
MEHPGYLPSTLPMLREPFQHLSHIVGCISVNAGESTLVRQDPSLLVDICRQSIVFEAVSDLLGCLHCIQASNNPCTNICTCSSDLRLNCTCMEMT